MKFPASFALAAAAVASLLGCATAPGVTPVGPDTFMVLREAATSFGGIANLKADALREAQAHCAAAGRAVQVVQVNESKPPFIMGNYPRAEVHFMCLAKGDPALARPRLRKDPDTVIEIRQQAPHEK